VMAGEHLDVESIMDKLKMTSRRKAARLGVRADRLIHHTTLLHDLRGERIQPPEEIASIKHPILCCYGSESDLLERGRELADLLPDSRYEFFIGATHSLLAERTTELRSHLIDWITTHAAHAVLTAGDVSPLPRRPRPRLVPAELS
jgi:hypothetical protein